MIPMSEITAGGNSGEINTSTFVKVEAETGQTTKRHLFYLH